MANYLEYTSLNPANGYVGASSRYAGSQIVYYGEQHKIAFNVYVRQTRRKSNNDRYYVIPPGYAFRPDMVSYIAYGLPDYWWVLMEANSMQDVMEFKAGVNIWIPGDIYNA